MLLLQYKAIILVIIIVSSVLLIMAGDVELNPGPRGFRKSSVLLIMAGDVELNPGRHVVLESVHNVSKTKSETCGNCGLPLNSRKTIEATKQTQWNKQSIKGKRVHSAASEPYYFDAAYQLVEIDFPIPVDENGKCMITNIITNPDIEIKTHLKWQCHSQCKPLTIAEVNAIVLLKEEFQNPMKEVLHTV